MSTGMRFDTTGQDRVPLLMSADIVYDLNAQIRSYARRCLYTLVYIFRLTNTVFAFQTGRAVRTMAVL